MMPLFSNIESIFNTHLDFAAIVVNNSGLVEFANDKAREFFVVDNAFPFFNIFEGDNSITAERIFLESKNNNQTVEEKIYLSKINSLDNVINYNLVISPFNVENETYFFVSIKYDEDAIKNYPDNKIRAIKRSEILNNSDVDVLKVVDKIKNSYPFTLIEKKRIQKEIDLLDESFWIKDALNNYITVNKKFANSLKLSSQDIEGKKSEDIYDKAVSELFEMADNFIKSTLKGIKLDGISEEFNLQSESSTEYIQLPISDAEKNIIVTIGFSRKKTDSVDFISTNTELTHIIKSLPLAGAVFDEKLDIDSTNILFDEMFNIAAKHDLDNFKNIVPPEVLTKIKNALKKVTFDKSSKFYHNLIIGEEPNKVEFLLSNLNISRDGKKKYLLVLNKIDNTLQQPILKENIYDTLIKNSPNALFIYEVDNLKFLDVNEAAIKMYGYSHDEFLQMDLTDLYTPEDIQSLLESTNDKSNMSGSYTGPWRHKRKDGSSVLVEISKTEIIREGKKVHINYIKDITEDINTTKELQLFKTSFDNSRDLMILTDTDGFITFTNEHVNKTLGFFDEELEKRPFLSLLSDGDRAKVNTNIFHSGKNEINTFDIKLKNSEGEFIQTKIIATPILNLKKEVESFSLILQPNIAAKDFEIQPVTINDEKSMGKLDPSFLSNLFHELLTPINVIIGFVQELIESIPDPSSEQKESAEIIKENQKVLLQTMDTAVEYSNLEQENIELKGEEIKFVDVLKTLEEDTAKEAIAQNVNLSYSKISSSLSFFNDKHRFVTLTTLLIQFAMKMTKEKKLFLSAYQNDADSFILGIKDTRGGISTTLLKNLRELFTADESILRHSFGISRFSIRLVRKLTELLANNREVILKKGSPFEFGIIFPTKMRASVQNEKVDKTIEETVDFPDEESTDIFYDEVNNQILTDTDRNEIVQPEELENGSTPASSGHIDFSQLSCLYVEDQIDSQILFKIQMKELKQMEFVTNFEDAIPLLQNNSFNFIVLDINLQGEYNGLDALHIIRKMPVYHDIPIIAVSAYVLPGDRENFIATGFNDFITKPVLQDKLYDSLRKIL